MKFILTTPLLLCTSINAFTIHSSNNAIHTTTTSITQMNMNNNNYSEDRNRNISERRTFLRNMAGVAFGTSMGMLMNEQPASATYSAYTNREKDWQARKENGEIQYSTARDLRRQLQEVAPMNVSKSQVFCPNGPSSAVSPLMENKCNDQLAMPSVFGRSDDILGNSIPGRNAGGYIGGGTSGLSAGADTGGFPAYK